MARLWLKAIRLKKVLSKECNKPIYKSNSGEHLPLPVFTSTAVSCYGLGQAASPKTDAAAIASGNDRTVMAAVITSTAIFCSA